MTITYTGKVANARLCSFSRLLFYWRGSIYKLMYKEMFIFCGLYALISLMYRFALEVRHKRLFEQISLYCRTFTDLIPMAFILGFYVSIVVTRWWNQYMKIPWPDRVMMYLAACLEGVDEHARLVRRTIVRYLTLGSLLVFQNTAVSVKKRFPTIGHLVEAGVLTPRESKHLDDVDCPHGKWWIPFLWITNMLKDARRDGRISDSFSYKSLLDEVMLYRGSLGELYSYDWISVPLVYTQVTTLAVYMFFLGALFGQQFLDPTQGYPGHSADLYFPLFTLMQFFFYMGWLKVAEQLINPFGEDDDDFEMNWIIDRNLQISLLAVDDLYGESPALERDMYYGEPPPEFLPYTKSSIATKIQPHMGSMADLAVSSEGMRTVNPMETIREGVASRSSNVPIPQSPSHFESPWGSPCKTPNLRIPASISKLSIDGADLGDHTGYGATFGSHSRRETNFGSHPGRETNFGSHTGRETKFGSHTGRETNFGSHTGRETNFGSHTGRETNFGSHRGRETNFGSHTGRETNFGSADRQELNFVSHGGRDAKFLSCQPVEGSLGSKAQSYMEWWHHRQEDQDDAKGQHNRAAEEIVHSPSPRPQSPIHELIFQMEEGTAVKGTELKDRDSGGDCHKEVTDTPQVTSPDTLLRTRSLTRGPKSWLAKGFRASTPTQTIAKETSGNASKACDVVVQISEAASDQKMRSRHTSSSDDSSVDYNFMRHEAGQKPGDLLTPLLHP